MKHRLANLTGSLAQSGRKETPAFGEHLSRIISEFIQGREYPGGRFVKRGHGRRGVSKSSSCQKLKVFLGRESRKMLEASHVAGRSNVSATLFSCASLLAVNTVKNKNNVLTQGPAQLHFKCENRGERVWRLRSLKKRLQAPSNWHLSDDEVATQPSSPDVDLGTSSRGAGNVGFDTVTAPGRP
jgi:hypothetical protein